MIKWIINIIVRRELNKIDAYSEEQFYDIVCNKYNNREDLCLGISISRGVEKKKSQEYENRYRINKTYDRK